jgi:hypothetical protein
MYIGVSPYLDFFVCLGLGIAFAACLNASLFATRAVHLISSSTITIVVLRVFVFASFGLAMLSIAAMIGHTKPIRDANSALGFVLGAGLMLPLVLRSFRLKQPE